MGTEPAPIKSILKQRSGKKAVDFDIIEDDYYSITQQSNKEEDIGTSDERLHQQGARVFREYQTSVKELDKELRKFSSAARQLGGSVAILLSSHNLRVRLSRILNLFWVNASQIYPLKVERQTKSSQETINLQDIEVRHDRQRWYRRAPWLYSNPINRTFEDLDLNQFPQELSILGTELTAFLECLNDFPESVDEVVESSISVLVAELKYRVSCLKAHQGEFQNPNIQAYMHEISGELRFHLDEIASSLSVFTKIGVPTILMAQKHANKKLLNMSTVSTIFSAVTATTMQFSYTNDNTPLAVAVNAFWFTSLVFSIGGAVNSWLAISWKQAMYCSPKHRLPRMVRAWVNHASLVFLVVSVVCFTIGLSIFAFSSAQGKATSTLTAAFCGCSILGTTFMTLWFALERFIFAQHHGAKWLWDVLRVDIPSWIRAQWRRFFQWLELPSTEGPPIVHSRWPPPLEQSISNPDSPIPIQASSEYDIEWGAFGIVAQPGGTTASTHQNGPTRTTDQLPSLSSPALAGPFAHARARVTAPIRHANSSNNTGQSHSTAATQVDTSRLSSLTLKLRELHVEHTWEPHMPSIVKAISFSPDGQFVSTSSLDKTLKLWQIPKTDDDSEVLQSPAFQLRSGPMAWSPTGDMVVVKSTRSIRVWMRDGQLHKRFDDHMDARALMWPVGSAYQESFFFVEGSNVRLLDIAKGNVTETHHFEHVHLREVAVHDEWLVAIGSIHDADLGMRPSSNTSREKQIILYNIEQKQIHDRVPLLQEVRHIKLDKLGSIALVSYDSTKPPESWAIEQPAEGPAKLKLRRTYLPRRDYDSDQEFLPSCFGGKDDELVICPTRAGRIDIWDRDGGTVLHRIYTDGDSELEWVAWNSNSDIHMLAAATHDGKVTIWTLPDSDEPGILDDEEDQMITATPTATRFA